MGTRRWTTALVVGMLALASADALALQQEKTRSEKRKSAATRAEVSRKSVRPARSDASRAMRSNAARAARSEARAVRAFKGESPKALERTRVQPRSPQSAERRQAVRDPQLSSRWRAQVRPNGEHGRQLAETKRIETRKPQAWTLDGGKPETRRVEKREREQIADPALWKRYPREVRPAEPREREPVRRGSWRKDRDEDGQKGRDKVRDRDRDRGRDRYIASPRVKDPVLWRRLPPVERRHVDSRDYRRVRERWSYGAYGSHYRGSFGYWGWHWYYDPFWHSHRSVVFVFRRGHGHLFDHHHHAFGHHHGIYLHHGYFHDYLFDHHGHIHFVIVIAQRPRYDYVPVYHAPVDWVIEERDVPVLVREGVPGAYYADSCAMLEIVTRQGSVLKIAVDPADFGAENVGQLRDILEEALAATGQLDLEDLAGVRHVIPRESIQEIRGGPCQVD